MKHYLVFIIAAFALSACSPKADHVGHDLKQDTVVAETQQTISPSEKREVKIRGVATQHARVLPPFPGKDTAAAYFTLRSMGQDNRLIAVSSSISNAVEIHNHIEENGVMKMRRVDGVVLPQDENVEFKPGSYHIMMFKAHLPDDVNEVELTLTFEKGAPVTVTAPVEGREMEDDHSGH